MKKKEKHITTSESGGRGNENETDVLKYYILQCVCQAEDDYGKIVQIGSQNNQLGHKVDDIYYRTDKDIMVLIDNKKTLTNTEIQEAIVSGYHDFINPQFDQENLRIQITTQSNSNAVENLKNLLESTRDLNTFDRLKFLWQTKITNN